MKKHLLMLFAVIVAATMSLKAQTIVINDGFENGIQDSVWTQEFVLGNHPWAVEGTDEDLQWPTTVLEGSKRAYLRNTSGETQGYITRLVSKVMDLRPEVVYQAELTFWYANPKWTADRDTLRVLYRTGAKAAWKTLAEYSTASANWQKVKLELPEVNETYQIAFEGTDNLGRGIVLDGVLVRSAPECTVPHDIAITNKGAGNVNIAWNASWDANFFDLVVSKNKINPDTVDLIPDSMGVIAFHEQVSGLQQNYDVELVSGENYYIYLRSICETETSLWNSEDPNQGEYYFRVKATKSIPYSYGFDMPYEPGVIRRDLEWTWGGNTGAFNPFINVNSTLEERGTYSKSNTSCVVFTGANNLTTAIPAHKYAYVATPALTDTANANFALNQCRVRFWGTVAGYQGRSYAHSLIVGAMTDPEDITSFVAIDTVSVWGTSTFEEFVVDLSSYQGTGNYVAFMSAFETQNIFYLDDITVEYNNDGLQKPTAISVNPRDNKGVIITWKGNSPKYNVLITNAEVDPTNPEKSAIVETMTVFTNRYISDVLEADHSWNRPYYVYVQAVNEDKTSAWSYRYPFVTIANKKDVPFTIDFEQKNGKTYTIGDATAKYPVEIGIFSNDPEYPHLVSSNPHAGSSCLYLTKDWGNDSWITLPPVDSLQTKQVTFYLSGSSTPTQATATIGVMTNPMDINTFIPVAECKVASSGYTTAYANFANYNGPEGVIAIVWSDVDGGKQTINYIDDITVDVIAQCLPPVNIQTAAESDTVTVSWDKSIATTWEFVLSAKQITGTQLEKLTFDSISHLAGVAYADTIEWTDPQGNPTFGFGELTYNTPYYIYVRTLCGEEKTWWVQGSFVTPCPTNFPIPFTEDFNSYAASATEVGCWELRNYGGTGYPKTLNLTSGAQSGIQLELWSTGTTHRCIAALPGLDADLTKVVLSFDTRSWSTSAKSVLYVGSMGDLDDPSTFVAVDTFYNADGNTFQKVRMDLADYTLAYNNIVFSSGLGETLEMNSDVMIDNIVIKPNTCIEAWDFEATDIQMNTIDIKWNGKSTDNQWMVKVMDGNKVIINDTVVTGKAFHAEGLQAVTLYTFWVRPSCDTIWSSASYRTSCVKLDPTKPNKEDFESITDATTSYKATSQIPCWTVGNGNPSATTSYIPFVYKSTTYSNSGNNTYRAYGYSTTNSPAYIASPEIDCETMTDLAVTFNIYAGTSYWWICGVMSDPEDLSTFVAIDSVKGTGASVQYTYDLSEYKDKIPATAKYFAWRGRYGVTDYLYLDDVSIIKITCPLTKPSFSGVSAETARISSGLRTENEWILLAVDTAAFNADQLALLNVDSLVHNDPLWQAHVVFYDTIPATSRSYVLTGLKEQTDYYIATATVCEDGMSSWATTSFKTPCKAITPEALGTVTFSTAEGFVTGSGATRYLPCWTTGNKSGNASATSSYIPYVYTTASYLHNKNNCLYFYSYVPTSASSTKYGGAYAIMPELEVDDIAKYQVNFWARTTSSTGANYNYNFIVGVITDPTDLNTFVAVDTITLSATYEPFSISLEEYEGDYMGDKGRYVMFLAESGDKVYCYAYLSEVSVTKIPTCRNVTAFSVDSVAEDAAMISWKQYSDSYRVLVADEAVADSLKATYNWLIDSVVTKTDSVLLTGLKASAQYFAYAQALCDSGDSSDISMASAIFTTLCPSNGFPVPYKQDFERYATNAKVVDCWDFEDYAASTKTYPEVMNPTSGAVSGKQLELWSTSTTHRCVAIAPKVQGNLTDYMLSFDARSYSVSGSSVLYVGTMDDILDSAAGFAPFDTIYMTTGNEFYHRELVLADYADKLIHSRIAFSSGLAETLEMASDMYLDNVRIGLPPSCFAPTLEAGSTSMYTATINITPAKEGNNKWQLAIVPDSVYTQDNFDADNYLADTLVRIVDADSTNFVISDLTPGTKYWIYARTVCGGDDGSSEWTTQATTTRTKYYFKDSYFFGFEKEEGWEFCKNSTSTTYWINPALEVGYNGGTATTSYTSYYPYSMNNTATAIYGYGPHDNPKTGVLRWQATTSYWGGYVVFPAVAEAHDRSFEFKVRAGYGLYVTAKDTMAVSSPADYIIEVGTIDKNKGYETYQVLATLTKKALDKTKMTAENDWLWTSYTLDLDSATVADKQMVIRAPKPTATEYLHFDNVALTEKKGYGLVSIKSVLTEGTKATVIWEDINGPWNLYILKANGDTLYRYENLSGITSQEVTGLSPKTKYTAVLVAANAPTDTKFEVRSIRDFRTPCQLMEPDANGEFFWDFDDANETEPNDILAKAASDTAYLKPSCFTTATNYTGSYSNGYQWLWQSKGHDYYSTLGNPSDTYNHREIGYGDSYGSLRVYTTSTYVSSTVNTWIALPQLHCDLDTMMIEFWGRCLANQDETASSNAGKVISTTYLGASYSKSLVIGTMTDPTDFSTIEVIDTVTYAAPAGISTSTLVSSDPTGNRYWQKFQLPLAGTNGKYIVLFQPAYGLFFVDNLAVKPVGNNLFAPSGAHTSEVTGTGATFNWTAKHPTIQTVVVVTDQDGTTEILRDTIAGSQMTFTVDTLKPATGYQWYVYQINDEISTQSTAPQAFYTECVAIAPDYATGFELADGWKILPAQTSETYKQTICWTYENAGSSAVSTYTYNYVNGTSLYSHKGDYALRLYAYGTSYQTYAAMPAIEDIAAYDTLQVNFWMRPGYASKSTGKISTQYTLGSSASTKEYYYSKSVIVGTMTDPMDASTFVPIDTLTYNGTLATTDVVNEANEFLFQPKKVVLAGAQGKYIAFMATLYAKGETRKSTYDYIWIDDISLTPVQRCEAPETMTATEVGAHKATLNWEAKEGAASYVLQVSTDYTFTEDTAFVYNDTVASNTFTVTGLKAYEDYVWRVRTICADDLGESEFSMNANFTTAREPFFVETFGAANLDADWQFATNPAITVIDSADVELTGANSTSYGWRRTNVGTNNYHYAALFYSSSSESTTDYDYYWMITPTISLDETKPAHLTFDMALTGASATSTVAAIPATEASMADDYTFMIALSEDGGKTWKKENILGIWNNTLPEGNQLRDIPFNPANMRYDLSKYAGKNVRIAFYREADTYKGTSPYSCAVHLDNIRVNYFDIIEDAAQACQYEDIDKLGFYINGDEAEAGEQTLKRIEKAYDFDANTKGYHDSIFVLNVEYMPVEETFVTDTICEGETYTDINFNGKDRTGTYRRKLQSVEHCDSLVTLNLYVIPRAYAEDMIVTICQGESYTWNGVEYNRAGLYADTAVSAAGCDSITQLIVRYYADEDTIYDAIRVALDELPYTYQNEAHPYVKNQAPIVFEAGTAKGEYTRTAWVQGENCAAVLVLTAEIYDSHEGIDNVTFGEGARKIIFRDNLYIICNDEWYNAAGQKVSDPRK